MFECLNYHVPCKTKQNFKVKIWFGNKLFEARDSVNKIFFQSEYFTSTIEIFEMHLNIFLWSRNPISSIRCKKLIYEFMIKD